MDVLAEMLTTLGANLGAGIGTRVLLNAANVIGNWLHGIGRTRKHSDIRDVLVGVGKLSPEHIRSEVHKFAVEHGLPKEQEEAIVGTLLSVSRNAHTIVQSSSPKSSILRSPNSIGVLLDPVGPARTLGQPVGSGQNWVLNRFLGRGSFGEVWRAHNDMATGLPDRAVKIFTHEGAQEWLDREKNSLLAVMNKLGAQSHIVQLLDVVVQKGEQPFLVFEYVPGGSLEDWILEDADRRPVLRKTEIIRGLVSASALAHKQGIYHRDLKPANILLTSPPDVQAKIADFGLAKVEIALRAAANASESSRPSAGDRSAPASGSIHGSLGGSQVGTPMYWPPEAWESFAERDAAKDDIFAIGAVWYQLLVERLERPPYDFADALRDAGQDSQTIQHISRCLARPDHRFADARALDDELNEAAPPEWPPIPAKCFDISQIVKEYLTTLSGATG